MQLDTLGKFPLYLGVVPTADHDRPRTLSNGKQIDEYNEMTTNILPEPPISTIASRLSKDKTVDVSLYQQNTKDTLFT